VTDFFDAIGGAPSAFTAAQKYKIMHMEKFTQITDGKSNGKTPHYSLIHPGKK